MYSTLLVVRSKGTIDATVRLQSDAVLRGLAHHPAVSARVVEPAEGLDLRNVQCVLFHFDDAAAIKCLRALKPSANTVFACFGCDLYNFSRYLPSYEIADLYLMPTELHAQILASQFYKPVFHLPECIDPITCVDENVSPVLPAKRGTKLFWFGYAESFDKGMGSLLPVITRSQKEGRIASFSLILNQEEFTNEYGFPTIPFRMDSFRTDAAAFDYCILSHFSLDLSLNSFVKSPNKLITALMVGAIPIASNTPNYSALLRQFGLHRFLFDSPLHLAHLLRNLDPVSDSRAIADSGIAEALSLELRLENVAQSLLTSLSRYGRQDTVKDIRLQPRLLPPREQPVLSCKQHIKCLLPSFSRDLRRRLRHTA